MTTTDKIPIGKYEWTVHQDGGRRGGYIKIKFKNGVENNVKQGDIITLDMIEPYESEAVRKVKGYISSFMYSPPDVECTEERWTEHAREIVKLVHEAEDADE